jgi:hypothetical protein
LIFCKRDNIVWSSCRKIQESATKKILRHSLLCVKDAATYQVLQNNVKLKSCQEELSPKAVDEGTGIRTHNIMPDMAYLAGVGIGYQQCIPIPSHIPIRGVATPKSHCGRPWARGA